jgi:hypothetical protein
MRFQVLFHSPLGVLFTFPSRYWFTIGHWRVLSLGRWASRIHTGFHVTRVTWEHAGEDSCFSCTGLSPSVARLIQTSSTKQLFCNFPGAPYRSHRMSHNPAGTTDMAFTIPAVWADPRSLAATDGVAYCFTFLRILRCFSSPGSPHRPIHSAGDRRVLPGGVSPFGNPRVACLPANRGLSQVATSFIAFQCQGIHRTPLKAWSKNLFDLVFQRPGISRGGYSPDTSGFCKMLVIVTLAFNCQRSARCVSHRKKLLRVRSARSGLSGAHWWR